MTLPFRGHRSRNSRRPVFDGDFPDDSESVTETLNRVRVPDWDATGIPFLGTSAPLPPAGFPVASGQAGQDTEPFARYHTPPPPPMITVAVTVGNSTGNLGNARLHAALEYIRIKYALMTVFGQLDRIDEAERMRLRGDPIPPMSSVGQIRRETAVLLHGETTPWVPRAEPPIRWYDPHDPPAVRAPYERAFNEAGTR